jgi:hypothetical protein
VPLALQDWRGQPAIVSGVVFTAATLTWTGGAWIQAQRIERIGPRPFLATGFAVLAIGIVGFALILIPSVPLITAVVAWSVAGLAMGLSYSTLSLVVLREASVEQQGAATAGLQLSDVLGTSLGTGLGGGADRRRGAGRGGGLGRPCGHVRRRRGGRARRVAADESDRSGRPPPSGPGRGRRGGRGRGMSRPRPCGGRPKPAGPRGSREG